MDQSDHWHSCENVYDAAEEVGSELAHWNREMIRLNEQLSREQGKVVKERIRVATVELELNLVNQEREELNDELMKQCEENEALAASVKKLQAQLSNEQAAKEDLKGRMESLNTIVEAATASVANQDRVLQENGVRTEEMWKEKCHELAMAVAQAHERINQLEQDNKKKAGVDADEFDKERNKRGKLEQQLEAECQQNQLALSKHKEKEAALVAEFDAERQRLHDLVRQRNAVEAEQNGRLEGQREFVRELSEKIQQISQEKDKLEEAYLERIQDLSAELKAGQAAQRDLAAASLDEADAKLKEKDQHIAQLEGYLVLQRQRCDTLESDRNVTEAEKNEKLREVEYQNLAYENDLTGLRGRIAVADQALEAKKEEVLSVQRRLEEYQLRLQEERQRCSDLELNLTKCQKDREIELASLRDQNQELDALLVHARSNVRELENQLQTVNDQKAAEHRAQGEHARRLAAELDDEKELRKQIEKKIAQMQKQHEQQLCQTNVRLAAKESELASKADSVIELDGRLDAQREYMESFKSKLHEAQLQRDEALGQIARVEERLQAEIKRSAALDNILQQQREEERVVRDQYEREMACERAHREEILRTYRETTEGRIETQSRRIAELEEHIADTMERNTNLSRLLQASQMEIEDIESTHRHTIADLNSMKQVVENRLADVEKDLCTQRIECQQFQEFNERLSEDLSAARKRNDELRKEEEQTAQKNREMTAELNGILQEKHQQMRELQVHWEERDTQKDQDLKKSLLAVKELQGELNEEKQRCIEIEASHRNAQDVWNLERQRHLDQVEQLEREVQIRGEKVAILEQDNRQAREDRTGLQVHEQVLSRKVLTYENQLQRSITKAADLTTQLDEKENQLREAMRLKKLLQEAQEDKKQELAQKSLLRERIAMQSNELQQRRLEGDLELRRTRGALDESRKVLRDMNFGPRLTSDGRAPRLEAQLASEKMKVVEMTFKKENSDHKLKIMQENYERERARCTELSKQLFTDERQRLDVHEELGTVKAQLAARDSKIDTMRERMSMLTEEHITRKMDSNLQVARLQGQLEESRFLTTQFASPQKRPSLAPK
eukprot:gnl/MRDRNA2_/MRDRNA2_102192_c0_seq1.p1 gnl/MRDRNA2_/MRDRNA2_102192_c0~~gnl/MRDRNA2_/MRDRNA2_102192_c0_seq1.p1  ORF type:complete len:1080 (-),score=358.85 gnl/MRDRNA2_/MRDRNA2_102192_c0_seq1:68-3307(-)